MFLIVWTIQIYSLIVLARVLLSFFPNIDPYHPVVRFLYNVTEPLLQPIRVFLRDQFGQTGMFDFSPLVLIMGLWVLQQLILAVF